MSFYNKSLNSMLQQDVERQQQQVTSALSTKKPKKEDNRRAVINFRLFVVLRPPTTTSPSNGFVVNPHQQSSLHMMLNSRVATSRNYQKLAEISRLSKIARKVDAFAGRNGHNNTTNSASTFANMLNEASRGGASSSFSSSSFRGVAGGDKTSFSNLKSQQQQERERIRAEADGDEDAIIRDIDADDEADAIWDEHALAVIPFVMQITFSQTTVADVMQKAWPYIVELWRNEGRFWHKNMVPLPIATSSNWFCLRMIGKKWHDPSRSAMRSCLEPPVPTILAGFNYSGFEGLQTSLAHCSFQERGLNSQTLIRKLLPEDPNAHLKSMSGSASQLAKLMMGGGSSSSSRFSGANSAVSSAVHGGLTDANRQRRDNSNINHHHHNSDAPLPRYRMNLLITLSTDYLLLEHLVCCEMQTRRAIFAAIEGFFEKMKIVEQTSLDCAFKRTLHRQRIEKLFSDLMDQETKRRERFLEQEERVFFQQIRKPYEESQEVLLPVLREAHAIRLSWRARLAEDMEKVKRAEDIYHHHQQHDHENNDDEQDYYVDLDDEDEEEVNRREISPSCGVD